MKFKTLQEIETRKAEILQEMEKDGADLDALKKEMDELRENAEAIRNAAAKAAETRRQIANGAAGITVQESHESESRGNTVDEIRSTPAYAEAFKRYILNEDATELRALLTTNAPNNGQYPVPVVVDGIIKTAWENDEILSRVNKTYIRGNLKTPFERAADGAYQHEEGTTAVTEEDLTLGVVTLTPKNIKKWIKVSDEIVAMGGEAFVSYIYSEITYRVLQKLVSLLITAISSASTSHSDSAIGIPKITKAPGVTVIPEAAANLSEEARNVVVVMNRLSGVAFLEARAAGNFAIDPFDGLTVLYCSALPAYSTASDNAVYMIVGDLKAAHVNYPEGDDVIIKWDDLSLAEADLVKVIGRQYAGYAVDRPGMLCNIAKPAAAATT